VNCTDKIEKQYRKYYGLNNRVEIDEDDLVSFSKSLENAIPADEDDYDDYW
jgi:hypothetical protein